MPFIGIRVSDEEMANVVKRAKQLKMNTSDYMRELMKKDLSSKTISKANDESTLEEELEQKEIKMQEYASTVVYKYMQEHFSFCRKMSKKGRCKDSPMWCGCVFDCNYIPKRDEAIKSLPKSILSVWKSFEEKER